MLDSTLADLVAVFQAFLDRFPEMKPDIDARNPVFLGGLRETDVRPHHLTGPAALLLEKW
jgi:hypothetical protein